MAERAESNLEAAAESPPGGFLPFFFLQKKINIQQQNIRQPLIR